MIYSIIDISYQVGQFCPGRMFDNPSLLRGGLPRVDLTHGAFTWWISLPHVSLQNHGNSGAHGVTTESSISAAHGPAYLHQAIRGYQFTVAVLTLLQLVERMGGHSLQGARSKETNPVVSHKTISHGALGFTASQHISVSTTTARTALI